MHRYFELLLAHQTGPATVCAASCQSNMSHSRFHSSMDLQVNAYDLVGALDMLAQLESEQTGQRKQYLQVCTSTVSWSCLFD